MLLLYELICSPHGWLSMKMWDNTKPFRTEANKLFSLYLHWAVYCRHMLLIASIFKYMAIDPLLKNLAWSDQLPEHKLSWSNW